MKVTQKLIAPFKALAKNIAQRCRSGRVATHTVEVTCQPELAKTYVTSAPSCAQTTVTKATQKTYDFGIEPIHNTALNWRHIRETRHRLPVTLPSGKQLLIGALSRDIPYNEANDNVKVHYPSAWRANHHFHMIDMGGKLYTEDVTKLPRGNFFDYYACRDYVNADLKLRLHPELRRVEGGHALNRARLFADAKALAMLVEDSVESNKLNMALRFYSPIRYVVDPFKKTNFFYDIMDAMDKTMLSDEKRVTQNFLISTARHALTMTMKIVERDDGMMKYSITFYDPNETYTHQKHVVGSSIDLKDMSFEDIVWGDIKEYKNPDYPWWTVIPVTQEIIDDVKRIAQGTPEGQEKAMHEQKAIDYGKDENTI